MACRRVSNANQVDTWLVFSLPSLCLAGNALREDFTFRHTFSSEVAKLLKASPGQVVISQPEKFRSKYEPASHTLAVKVLPILSFSVIVFFTSWDLKESKKSLLYDLFGESHLWTQDTCIYSSHRTLHWCQKCRSSSKSMRSLWWATENQAMMPSATPNDPWWLCTMEWTSALTTGKVSFSHF